MAKGRRVSGIWVPIQLDTSAVKRDMEALGTQLSTSVTKISRAFEGALNPKNILKGVVDVNKAFGELRDSAKVWGALTSGSQPFEAVLRRLRPELRELAKQFGGTVQQQREMYTEMARAQAVDQEVRALSALQQALGKTRQETVEFVRARGAMVSSDALARFAPTQQLQDLSGELGKTAAQYRNLARAAGEVANNSGFKAFQNTQSIRQAIGAYEELHAGQRITVRQYEQIARAANVSTEAVARYVAESRKASAAGGRGVLGIFTPSSVAAGAQSAMASLGVVGGMYGVTELGKAMYQASLKMDNMDIAFESIYKSAARAGAQMDYVRKLSEDLGLSFVSTAEGAKKLFASAQGTELEKDANQIFRAFSKMGAALKLSGTEMDSVFLAVSQIISKGKVSAEELRLQLSERMPGAVNLFAKAIGVTTQKLDDMLQKGEVGLDSLRKFAVEVEKTYSAGAAKAATGLQAEMNRVANAWFDLKRAFVDSDASAKALSSLTSGLRTLVGFAPQIAAVVGAFAKMTLIAAPVYLLVKAIGSLVNGITKLRMAMAGGFLTTLLSPAAPLAAALAVGALGTAVVSLMSQQTKGEEAFEAYNNKLYDLKNFIKGAKDEYAELNAEMAKSEKIRKVDALKKAEGQFKAYTATTSGSLINQSGLSSIISDSVSTEYFSESQFEKQLSQIKGLYGKSSPNVVALMDQAKALGAEFVQKFSEGQKTGMSGDEVNNLVKNYAAKFMIVQEKLFQDKSAGEKAAESFSRTTGALLGMAEALDNAKRGLDALDSGMTASQQRAKDFENAFLLIKKAAKDTELEKKMSFGAEASSMATALVTMAKSAEEAEAKLFLLENVYKSSESEIAAVKKTTTDFDNALLLVGQTAVKNKADFAVLEEAIRAAGEKAGFTAAQVAALQAQLQKGFHVGGEQAVQGIISDLKTEQVLTKASAGQKKAYSILKQYAKDSEGQYKIATAIASGSADEIEKAFENTAITGKDAIKILAEANKTASMVDISKGAAKASKSFETVEKDIERLNRQVDTWKAKTEESTIEPVAIQLEKYEKEIDRLMRSGKASSDQTNRLKKVKKDLQDAAKAYEDYIRVREKEKAFDFYKSTADDYANITGLVDPNVIQKAAQNVYEKQLAEAKRFRELDVISQEEYNQIEIMLAAKKNDEILRNSQELYDNLSLAVEDYYAKYRNFATGMGEVMTTAMDGLASAIAGFATTGMQNFKDLGQAFADLANNILSMINKLLAQQFVSSLFSYALDFFNPSSVAGASSAGKNVAATSSNMSSMASSLPSFFAKGGAFVGSSLSSYSGSVVSTPTIFSMGTPIPAYAKGAGLMGEAGPEAVMPLIRTPSGHLGVRAEGGGNVQQNVVINIIDNVGVNVKQKESQDSQGNTRLDLMIEQQVAQSMARPGSPTNRVLSNTYGARPALANR